MARALMERVTAWGVQCSKNVWRRTIMTSTSRSSDRAMRRTASHAGADCSDARRLRGAARRRAGRRTTRRGHRRHDHAPWPPDRAVPRRLSRRTPPAASHSWVRSKPTRWASANCSCGSRCRWNAADTPTRPASAMDGAHARTRRRRSRRRTSPACAGSPYKIPTPWIAMYYFRIDAGHGSAARRGARSERPRAREHAERHGQTRIRGADRRRPAAARIRQPLSGHS